MTTGTVTWFDTDKGYGFLAPDDSELDVIQGPQAAAVWPV